jgi:hypothetical protein
MGRTATCTVSYYPEWSSRGFRAVRCSYVARFKVTDERHGSRLMCGHHKNQAVRDGDSFGYAVVVEDHDA